MAQSNTKPKSATSYKETAFGIVPHSRLLKLELEGTKRGLEFIHDLIQSHKHVYLSSLLICALHSESFGWIFPKWAGKYRTIQGTFSGKEAPSYYSVPEFMKNLCDDCEERLKQLPHAKSDDFIVSLVELLAWFQHRFVFIHPFVDYNGRTARMLTILLLLRLNLPPIELKADRGADRKRYLIAMQQADTGDLTMLETLISQALTEALRAF